MFLVNVLPLQVLEAQDFSNYIATLIIAYASFKENDLL